jgi:hypothetical protein
MWTGFYGYSHVELVFDRVPFEVSGSFMTLSDENLCFSASPRDGQTRFENINLRSEHWDVIEIETTEKEEQEIFFRALEICNKRYDWIGILFWFLFPLRINHQSKWWCSEAVGYILGHNNFRIHPNRMAINHRVSKIPWKFKHLWNG